MFKLNSEVASMNRMGTAHGRQASICDAMADAALSGRLDMAIARPEAQHLE